MTKWCYYLVGQEPTGPYDTKLKALDLAVQSARAAGIPAANYRVAPVAETETGWKPEWTQAEPADSFPGPTG